MLQVMSDSTCTSDRWLWLKQVRRSCRSRCVILLPCILVSHIHSTVTVLWMSKTKMHGQHHCPSHQDTPKASGRSRQRNIKNMAPTKSWLLETCQVSQVYYFSSQLHRNKLLVGILASNCQQHPHQRDQTPQGMALRNDEQPLFRGRRTWSCFAHLCTVREDHFGWFFVYSLLELFWRAHIFFHLRRLFLTQGIFCIPLGAIAYCSYISSKGHIGSSGLGQESG